MSYYEIIGGGIELTPTGKYILDYFGLTLNDLKAMSRQKLISYVKKFSDVLNDGRETISKQQLMKPDPPKDERGAWQMHPRKEAMVRGHSDSGSFSRYFSLDAWFQARIKHLPKEVQKTFPFLIVPKASNQDRERKLHRRK